MYKPAAWGLLAILILVGVGCQPREIPEFAIYLLADDRPATELSGFDLKDIALQEQPILTGKDLLSYKRLTHEMELTATAYRRIQELFPIPVKVNGIPFMVTVGSEPIYAGAFWTPLSSLSFDGVVIMQPFSPDETVIQIALGYPGSDATTRGDPRSDPRVMEALRAAGKLH